MGHNNNYRTKPSEIRELLFQIHGDVLMRNTICKSRTDQSRPPLRLKREKYPQVDGEMPHFQTDPDIILLLGHAK